MSGKDTTYNGWTNYETWLVKLWIDNEQAAQQDVLNAANELKDAGPTDVLTAEQNTRYRMEDWLKGFVDDLVGEHNPVGMRIDLVNAALSHVNWRELAEAYLADAEEIG